MKTVRTWVLIADGGHAKVFESEGPGCALTPIESMTLSADLPANRDILSDRPGRSFDSHGHSRHAMESPSDAHRELKREFARKVASLLEACVAQGKLDRLVVVAPPPALGDLREALSKAVRAKVSAELAQDLVKTPHSELPQHLAGVLGKPASR
jgi:protein required for attachment to host cells